MKKSIISIAFITCFSLTNFAQDTVTLDTEKSVVYWLGSSFLGFNNHHGTVKFIDGNVLITNDKISGGKFTIDMNSIANLDGGYNKGLVDHLKNQDFFHVFLYPTAILTIKEVIYKDKTHARMKADLTIKNTTKPVEFVAELNYERKELTTEFTINRTNWNIVYATRFVTNVKDKMLSEDIKFKVQLQFL